jgi:hypothetical protein
MKVASTHLCEQALGRHRMIFIAPALNRFIELDSTCVKSTTAHLDEFSLVKKKNNE